MGDKVKFTKEERLQFAKSRRRPLIPGIGWNCYIDPAAWIGIGCEIHHNVVIMGSVVIGDHCLIKSGSVIGEKGFSFEPENDTLIRVEHTGKVIIEDHVEVGSCCTICRATVDITTIGRYTKIDDHIHVAHNIKIGRRNQITAGTILGGSCQIGNDCFLGLNSTVKNKVRIGNNVLVGMSAVVVKDVEDNAVVVGNPAKLLRYQDERR